MINPNWGISPQSSSFRQEKMPNPAEPAAMSSLCAVPLLFTPNPNCGDDEHWRSMLAAMSRLSKTPLL